MYYFPELPDLGVKYTGISPEERTILGRRNSIRDSTELRDCRMFSRGWLVPQVTASGKAREWLGGELGPNQNHAETWEWCFEI